MVASLIVREQDNLNRIAVQSLHEVIQRLVRNPRMVHEAVKELRRLLADGMLASHLYGRRRTALNTQVILGGYDAAIKYAEKLAAMSPTDLSRARERYDQHVGALLPGLTEDLESSVREGFKNVMLGTGTMEESLAGTQAQVETALRTGMSSAFTAGRFEAAKDPEIAEILWGWEYVAILDDRVRDEHAALHGTKLPLDDPLWESIAPPNGFNCRCTLIEAFKDENPQRVEKDGTPDTGFLFNPYDLYNWEDTTGKVVNLIGEFQKNIWEETVKKVVLTGETTVVGAEDAIKAELERNPWMAALKVKTLHINDDWVGGRVGYIGTYESGIVRVSTKVGSLTGKLNIGNTWTVDQSVTGAVRHEHGHAAYDGLKASERMHVHQMFEDGLLKGLSKYGDSGTQEAFAEAVSAFTHKNYKGGLDPKVETFLRDKLGKSGVQVSGSARAMQVEDLQSRASDVYGITAKLRAEGKDVFEASAAYSKAVKEFDKVAKKAGEATFAERVKAGLVATPVPGTVSSTQSLTPSKIIPGTVSSTQPLPSSKILPTTDWHTLPQTGTMPEHEHNTFKTTKQWVESLTPLQRELFDQWSIGSNDMRDANAKGLKALFDRPIVKERSDYLAFMGALRKAPLEEADITRGIGLSREVFSQLLKSKSFDDLAMSSWTTSPKVAKSFATTSGGHFQVVLHAHTRAGIDISGLSNAAFAHGEKELLVERKQYTITSMTENKKEKIWHVYLKETPDAE